MTISPEASKSIIKDTDVSKIDTFEKIAKVLKLDPRLMGLAVINSFISQNSASRGVMFLNHISQALSLINGDEPLIQSGYEIELGKRTFRKIIENQSRILDIIDKFPSNVFQDDAYDIETTIIYHDLILNEINHVLITGYEKHHNYFGFKYHKTDAFKKLRVGDITPEEGLILALPSTVKENGGYSYGTVANTVFGSFPEVGEDAVWVSEEFCEKNRYNVYETRILSIGGDKIPLNLYGDDENYQPIPYPGQHVSDKGPAFATRQITIEDAIMTLLPENLQELYITDDPSYVRGKDGKLVDIDIIHNPPSLSKASYPEAERQIKNLYEDAIAVYKKAVAESTRRESNNNPRASIGNELHRYVVEALSVTNNRIKKYKKRTLLDTWTVKLTFEYTVTPTIKHKIAGRHGDKGVISKISPRREMPRDIYGRYTDVVMDSKSTVSRMNLGRESERVYGGVSSKVSRIVREMVSDNKSVNEIYNYMLGAWKIFDSYQYHYNLTVNETTKKKFIEEAVNDRFIITMPVDNPIQAYDCITSLMNYPDYMPDMSKIYIRNDDGTETVTEEDFMITPYYYMLLHKTGDSWLSAPTSRINVNGLVVSSNSKYKYNVPYSAHTVRTLGETEMRTLAAVLSPLALAELKHRAVSLLDNELIHRKLLLSKNPMNINCLIDRNLYPMDDDTALNMANGILANFGVELNDTGDYNAM
jgi:hypothetical protein